MRQSLPKRNHEDRSALQARLRIVDCVRLDRIIRALTPAVTMGIVTQFFSSPPRNSPP